MSSHASASGIVVDLPEITAAVVLRQDGAHQITSQLLVQLPSALVVRAVFQQAVVLQGSQRQVVDGHPDGTTAKEGRKEGCRLVHQAYISVSRITRDRRRIVHGEIER